MFCRNCGNKLQEGDKFCRVCGTKVAADEELNIANEESAIPEQEEPALKMTWNEEKEVKKSTEDVPKMHWDEEEPKHKVDSKSVNMVWEEEKPKKTADTQFSWEKEDAPKEPRKTSEPFSFDWSSVVDDKERKASKKIPTWRKAMVTNPENLGEETKPAEETPAWAKPAEDKEEHYVKSEITNPEPEDVRVNRLDKQYEPVIEVEVEAPKEPSRDLTKDEISGAIYEGVAQEPKVFNLGPEARYVKESITNPEPEDVRVNRLDKQYEPVIEVEVEAPKEPSRDLTKDEITGAIYEGIADKQKAPVVEPQVHYVKESITNPEPENPWEARLDKQYEEAPELEVETPKEPEHDVLEDEISGAIYDADYIEPEAKAEEVVESIEPQDQYVEKEIIDPEPENPWEARLDKQYEKAPEVEVEPPAEPVHDLFDNKLNESNFDVLEKDAEEVTVPEASPGDVLDEPEYVSPFDETDDLDKELKELEQELFAEMEENFVDEKATIKVDKFYTLDKKSEEFQQLLDNEYEKIKNKGVNYDLMEPEEDVTDSKEYEPTDFKIGSIGTAEAYGLDEEFFVEETEPEQKAEEKTATAKDDVEILEEDEDEEPTKKKSHGFLKFLVVLLLIMVLFEVFVLAMNNLAPDSSITQTVNDGIRQVTQLLTSQSVETFIGRC